MRIRVGLRLDDPFAIADTSDLLEAIPRNSWEEQEESDRLTYAIASRYATSRWSSARALLSSTIAAGDLGDSALPLLALLNQDSALLGFRHGLTHLLADAAVGLIDQPLLADVEGAGLVVMRLADREELMPYFGAYFLERPGPARLHAAGLLSAADEVFEKQIFDLSSKPGLLHQLAEQDMRRKIAERVSLLGLDADFADYLLSLRPATKEDADGLVMVCDSLLQVTRWIPPAEALRKLVEHWAEVAEKPGEVAPSLLLEGLAIEAIKRNCPRAAAVWSLEAYGSRPRLPALSRAMHEACSATDDELARMALAAPPWIEEQLPDEEREQFLLALYRVEQFLGRSPALRKRILELAELCIDEAHDPAGLRAGAYAQRHDEDPSSMSIHTRSDIEMGVFNMGLLGFEEEMVDRLPYVEEVDVERFDGGFRFTVPHLVSRAFRAAFEQGLRPHGLLQLADCSMEIGDMVHATTLIASAQQAGPRSISALLAQIKLGANASRRSERDRYALLLAEELRANFAALSPTELVFVLMNLPTWFFRDAPDIPDLVLADPRLAEHHDELAARFGS
jgi:hypothetical protein